MTSDIKDFLKGQMSLHKLNDKDQENFIACSGGDVAPAVRAKSGGGDPDMVGENDEDGLKDDDNPDMLGYDDLEGGTDDTYGDDDGDAKPAAGSKAAMSPMVIQV